MPEPLAITEPVVNYEFIRMPDSTGFGDYTESGQVIPVSLSGRRPAASSHHMFLNDHPPIAGGRELWGFPKKLAEPELAVETDTLVGTLDYGSVRFAPAHGLQAPRARHAAVEASSLRPISCSRSSRMSTARRASASWCDFHLEDITVKGAWTGPAALDLYSHALAPVAELPVLQVLSAMHLVADLTLGLGTVVHDYLAPGAPARRRGPESSILIEANAG